MNKIFIISEAESSSDPTRAPAPSEHYRNVLPCRHLRAPLKEMGIELWMGREQIVYQQRFGAIVASRLVPQGIYGWFRHVQRHGVNIVWELDDNFWHAPGWINPFGGLDRGMVECRLNNMRFDSDRIFVSTQPLADVFQSRDGVSVMPNLIDPADFPDAETHPEDDAEIRIFWAGSPTHAKDLELVNDAIRHAVKEDNRVNIYMAGHPDPGLAIELRPGRMFTFPWTDLAQYNRLITSIRPHIVVAPLEKTLFTDCKSNLRAIEGVMAGACVMASAVPAYDRCLPDRCLVKDGEWTEKLMTAVSDSVWRKAAWEESDAIHRKEFRWDSESAREPWLNAYAGLVSK